MKGETWASGDIIWRGGPEFSLLVPFNQDRKILVRDSWMRFNTKNSPTHVWDSWIEETYIPVKSSISVPETGIISILALLYKNFCHYNVSEHLNTSSDLTDDDIVKHLESDSRESKPFWNDLTRADQLYSYDDGTTATHEGSNFDMAVSERDQPIEEPWLFQSSPILLVYEDRVKPDMPEKDDNEKDEAMILDTDNQKFQETESLLPEKGSLISKENFVSTVILINSSICTMQRIAVLEDEKLVELLLEPVKSNVQCDSVYLGVVTKLVPNMGGAFVNIGNSRPSLMDIKHYREPFIFPPFRCRTKKQEVNGSASAAREEHAVTYDNDSTLHNAEDVAEADSQDDLVQFVHNDDEEHDGDDFDVSEVLKNVNGSIIDDCEAEADFEDFLEGDHHLDGESNVFFPSKSEVSNDSHTSHPQDMKESKHTPDEKKWLQVQKGTKVIVQVVKEGLGTKGPTLTAYPKLRSRFWVCFLLHLYYLIKSLSHSCLLIFVLNFADLILLAFRY